MAWSRLSTNYKASHLSSRRRGSKILHIQNKIGSIIGRHALASRDSGCEGSCLTSSFYKITWWDCHRCVPWNFNSTGRRGWRYIGVCGYGKPLWDVEFNFVISSHCYGGVDWNRKSTESIGSSDWRRKRNWVKRTCYNRNRLLGIVWVSSICEFRFNDVGALRAWIFHIVDLFLWYNLLWLRNCSLLWHRWLFYCLQCLRHRNWP